MKCDQAHSGMCRLHSRVRHKLSESWSKSTPPRRDYRNLGQLFEDLIPVLQSVVVNYIIDAEVFLELMTTHKHIVANPVETSRNLMITDFHLAHIHMFTYTQWDRTRFCEFIRSYEDVEELPIFVNNVFICIHPHNHKYVDVINSLPEENFNRYLNTIQNNYYLDWFKNKYRALLSQS